MKAKRHQKIIELIKNYDISTQEDLMLYLSQNGYDVTQATVSRDIKELRLIKSMYGDGKYKYVQVNSDQVSELSQKSALFCQSAKSIDYSGNIVVIKCYNGMANAACAILDALNFDGVLGSIAGDDTIFVLTKNEETSLKLIDSIKIMLD